MDVACVAAMAFPSICLVLCDISNVSLIKISPKLKLRDLS
jgi:hypothetical protein